MHIRIQQQDFDAAAELVALRCANPGIGAVVSFIGLARDFNDDHPVLDMTLEHYPGMTERALRQIADQALQRWPILDGRIVHRVGRIAALEQIVLVGVAAAHRHEAFEACRFLIDYLKTDAPFWKRESTPQGARWVEARDSDDQARAGWQHPPRTPR